MLEQKDWLQTELDALTSSQEDSLARTSALRADAKDSLDQGAAYGLSYNEYCSKFDPVGQSLRMSLGLELSKATESSLSWIEQVTPDGRWWWVLSMPEPRTDGNGFGLLPTPLASDAEKQGHGNLSHTVKMLPTPSATTYGRNKGRANPDGPERPSLETMAKGGMLPTPRSSPAMAQKMRNPENILDGSRLEDAIALQAAVSNGPGTGRLSPCFVEWMMGYPAGWTDASD